ncbi:exo-beta-N-acetylmuramidase NamZ domain-containing protein [Candidatus Dependentiae bacterium]
MVVKKFVYSALILFAVIFLSHKPATYTQYTHNTKNNSVFRLGVENITENFIKKFAGLNIGLITNQTGKDFRGRRSVDILLKKGLNIKKLFTPEHGMSGMIHTDKKITSCIDKKTRIQIVTLYSQGRTIKIQASMVKDIDMLLYDIQDAGMRHYTYITTLFEAMQSAAKCNKLFIVLDRPNLLGPLMDGPLVEPQYKSAISIAPIAMRHGMTVGELALYFNRNVLSKPVKLYIVKMSNYRRDSYANNRLTTFLSSGIRNLNSCYCYSFLGVLGEIRPFNIGLGTKRRFQCIMLNEKLKFSKNNWSSLQKIFQSFGVKSSLCKKIGTKNNFTGLALNVKDMYKLQSFNLLVSIISFFKQAGLNMKFSKMFDLAVGTGKVREFFEGKRDKKALKHFVDMNLNIFYKKASRCFLYKPSPKASVLKIS